MTSEYSRRRNLLQKISPYVAVAKIELQKMDKKTEFNFLPVEI